MTLVVQRPRRRRISPRRGRRPGRRRPRLFCAAHRPRWHLAHPRLRPIEAPADRRDHLPRRRLRPQGIDVALKPSKPARPPASRPRSRVRADHLTGWRRLKRGGGRPSELAPTATVPGLSGCTVGLGRSFRRSPRNSNLGSTDEKGLASITVPIRQPPSPSRSGQDRAMASVAEASGRTRRACKYHPILPAGRWWRQAAFAQGARSQVPGRSSVWSRRSPTAPAAR